MATTMAQGDVAWPEPSVRAILDQRRLRSVYQPIVDLCTGATVAYEALTRGPAGTSLESPDRLFQAARDDGLLAELDAACQAAALAGATAVGLGSANCLFINAEPNVRRPDPRHAGTLGGPEELGFDVVVELTERELARHPLTVLDDVRRLKALGFGIAIDDLGAEPASLALLPFIEPDIIKLDLRLIQDYGTAEIADIALAVQADAERRSSVVLAEGIETEADADTARVLGAEFGQGWHFGHPGPLPEPERRAAPGLWERLPHSPTRRTPARSPWELVADRPDRKVASKELLLPISHHIGTWSSGRVRRRCSSARFSTPITSRRPPRPAIGRPLATAASRSASICRANRLRTCEGAGSIVATRWRGSGRSPWSGPTTRLP